VAAPTAGLHFTKDLINRIKKNGVKVVDLTLHVGLGTFLPVKDCGIKGHVMHKEYYRISEESLSIIKEAKRKGKKIFAVGTTTTRVLEHIWRHKNWQELRGWTDIFIYPRFKFKCIDGLITNFHLPKSTLIMLVSAFAGQKNIKKAYGEAIIKKYRFYSYGDSMLII